MPRRRRALIVGGGLGGLATAIRLQHAGWDVTLYEKNERVGGRCSVIREDGFSFDTGPTLLLMRDVLDDLFASTGRDLADYLDLVRLSPNYRVRFPDGWCLELSSDLERLSADVEQHESGAGVALRAYLEDAAYKYQTARNRFVERNFSHWFNFFTPVNLYYLLTTNTMRKLDRHAGRYFHDRRLAAAFTFQTMYLGLAPRDAPSVYSLLPYTELCEGIWYPRGGMYRIVEALELLAGELGVSIETSTEVVALRRRGHRIGSAVLADGREVCPDVVICNADLPYAYETLLPQSGVRMRRLDHGCSAFLLYLGVDREYPRLLHHNVFLAEDTADNFDAIFRRMEVPEDPSLYLCAASRTDRSLAPPGREALYVLVPVPGLHGGIDWEDAAPRLRDRVYQRLEREGLDGLRRHVVFERSYTPDAFRRDYNIQYGSAFGISHGFRQIGYMRPSNKARGLDNAYFVGASTVPGGGIPMVVIGSRLTAERVQQDHG